MNEELKVGNEYLKIKILSISTSALIMLLSNGAYASSEIPTTPTDIDETNPQTEVVQNIDESTENSVDDIVKDNENDEKEQNDLSDTEIVNDKENEEDKDDKKDEEKSDSAIDKPNTDPMDTKGATNNPLRN